jgi:hypothetical protein
MTYEIRVPANYAFGTLTSALSVSDTTVNSAEFSTRLASGLSTTVYVPITLQNPTTGVFEIVWANSHTGAATSATVLRAKEDTTALVWPSGTLWSNAPTVRDGVLLVSTRAALPADPHIGLRALIQDENLVVEWNLSSGWGTPMRPILTRVASTSGVLVSTVNDDEAEIVKLRGLSRPMRTNVWYNLKVGLQANMSATPSSFDVRVRQGSTFGTSTELAKWTWIATAGGGATHVFTGDRPWKATSNGPTNYYVSIARVVGSGSGVASVLGDRRASFQVVEMSSDTTIHAEVS